MTRRIGGQHRDVQPGLRKATRRLVHMPLHSSHLGKEVRRHHEDPKRCET
ncbi:MAG: hypothetical protein ACJ79V_03725 [Myxococcales bacterium]